MKWLQYFQSLKLRTQYILLFFTGALCTLSFAPFYALPIWCVTLPICILSLKHAPSVRRAGWYGFWFGMGYFCTGLYWFAHALLIDAVRFGWLIPFAIGGISAVLALYHTFMHYVLYHFRHLPNAAFCCLFAVGWLAIEALRSILLSGFPWNLAGYSLAASDILLQIASLAGVWGGSLFVILLGSMPCWFIGKRIPYMFITLIICAAVGLFTFGSNRLKHHQTQYETDAKIRLVQANIKQDLKWDPNARYAAIQKHLELSRFRLSDDITHIIWSETAMTYPFEEGEFWAEELAKFAPANGSLITGVIRAVRSDIADEPPILYNSLKALSSEGHITAVYDKRKLVPFGEYIPFRTILPVEKITHGALDFSTGSHHASIDIEGLPPVRPLICYEAIFPYLSRSAHPAWLLNITNDAWFGTSTAPYQHFEMSRMRAVEQGSAMLRVANSGVSGVIDAYGRVLKTLPLNESGVIDTLLPAVAVEKTLFSRYTKLPVLGVCFILLLYVFFKRKEI